MKDSISDNLTREDIISEVKLFLDADFKHENCVIIVEGRDDILFFRGKLENATVIRESFSGKTGVLEILDYFNDYRVIGVCDRDYDTSPSNSQCFFYDNSCLEMMLIGCDEVFNCFVNTYYGNDDYHTLRETILRDLLFVSMYRRLNYLNGWGVNFDGLNYGCLFDDNTKNLDYSKVISRIKSTTSALSEGSIDEHVSIVEEKLSHFVPSSEGELNITNGHDFLYYFNRISSYQGKASSAEEMLKGLICSFRYDDFSTTELFSALSSYQRDKNLRFLIVKKKRQT